ncbi:MAG: hypothetical protein JWR34_4854, partial [Mycobacterium sp.]|nr:hypothetical protein [Mycobacterium sp.]
MHRGVDFVEKMIEDPSISLTLNQDTKEDYWGYPVPVSPFAKGHSPLAKYAIVRTDMRKLYQPNHDRFYTVAVEVFCDRPGLPRAGMHDDFEVRFVMRRIAVEFGADGKSVRTLATALMRDKAVSLGLQSTAEAKNLPAEVDVRDLWWSTEAAVAFKEENHDTIAAAQSRTTRQAWVRLTGGSRWTTADEKKLTADEQDFPMWRLPKRKDDCDATNSRSVWFGVVPTYSSEHAMDPVHNGRGPEPKLDEHGIYEIVCFVRLKPKLGHEYCPPKVWLGSASEPFRLASPMDPEGTKNRVISISLPDFRAMAARAGDKRGPGGVRIVTPPQSQMMLNPFSGKIPTKDEAKIGIGGGVCTFAIELFFIVAFFLFLLFMPIVVLAFQLWWMLALRFCIPPSVAFDVLANAAAEGKLEGSLQQNKDLRFDVDVVFGAATKTKD